MVPASCQDMAAQAGMLADARDWQMQKQSRSNAISNRDFSDASLLPLSFIIRVGAVPALAVDAAACGPGRNE